MQPHDHRGSITWIKDPYPIYDIVIAQMTMTSAPHTTQPCFTIYPHFTNQASAWFVK